MGKLKGLLPGGLEVDQEGRHSQDDREGEHGNGADLVPAADGVPQEQELLRVSSRERNVRWKFRLKRRQLLLALSAMFLLQPSMFGHAVAWPHAGGSLKRTGALYILNKADFL